MFLPLSWGFSITALWVHTSEIYAAVSESLFKCAQHMNTHIQNMLMWVLSVAQHLLIPPSGWPSAEDLSCQEWPELPKKHATRQSSKTCIIIRPAWHASTCIKLLQSIYSSVLLCQLLNHSSNEYLPSRVIVCIMAQPHTRCRNSHKSRQNGNQRLGPSCQEVTWVDQHAPGPLCFYGQSRLLLWALASSTQGNQTQDQRILK